MSLLVRRDFIKAGGAMVIGVALRDVLDAQTRGAVAGPPDARQIDTWLAIHADNTATVYVGFAELGQGASTALLQIAADELDLDMSQITSVRLDTNVTPNQGGTYSSASIARGGPQIRTAAAEARLALLRMASPRVGAPVESLTVSKGVVTAGGKRVTYGELIGDKPFQPHVHRVRRRSRSRGYKIVGERVSAPGSHRQVNGTHVYMQYVRIARNAARPRVRPRGQRLYGAGARVLSVDESSDPRHSGRPRGPQRRLSGRRRREGMGCRSRRQTARREMGDRRRRFREALACTNTCARRRPTQDTRRARARQRRRRAEHRLRTSSSQIARAPIRRTRRSGRTALSPM